MELLGEVGEFGLNHIPAKNAACESGPEGSNPSLSASFSRALSSDEVKETAKVAVD